MKRIGLAALLILGVCTGAKAADSGIDLYRECVGDEVGRLSCSAFIGGFLQAMLVVKKIAPGTLPKVCMPAHVSLGDGFVSWARAHPDALAREPGEAFAAALFDPAYCQQQPGLSVLR